MEHIDSGSIYCTSVVRDQPGMRTWIVNSAGCAGMTVNSTSHMISLGVVL
jgi:hypothetical protein